MTSPLCAGIQSHSWSPSYQFQLVTSWIPHSMPERSHVSWRGSGRRANTAEPIEDYANLCPRRDPRSGRVVGSRAPVR
jgi:hypothetical protein